MSSAPVMDGGIDDDDSAQQAQATPPPMHGVDGRLLQYGESQVAMAGDVGSMLTHRTLTLSFLCRWQRPRTTTASQLGDAELMHLGDFAVLPQYLH